MYQAITSFFKNIFFLRRDDLDEVQLLNHRKVAARLGVRRRAGKLARRNLPPLNDPAPTDLEVMIRTFYEQEMIRHQSRFQKRISGLRRTLIRQVSPEKHLAGLRQLPGLYLEQCTALQQQDRAALAEAEKQLQRAEHELQCFQERNAVAADTVVERPVQKAAIFLWVMVGLELLVNLVLFEQSGIRGIAGILLCLFIALVNGPAARSMGGNLHYFRLRTPAARVLGGLALLVVLLLPLFNLFAAHLRETAMRIPEMSSYADMVSMRDQLLVLALQEMVNRPIAGIFNLESLGLFIAGCVIAFFAVVSGYRGEERFPGLYGLDRRVTAAREDVRAAETDLQENTTRLRDQVLRRLEQDTAEALRATVRAVEEHRTFLALARDGLRDYEAMKKDCLAGCEYCIRLAWTENLVKRPDNGKPAAFIRPVQPLDLPDMAFELADEEQRIRTLEDSKAMLIEEKERLHEEIHVLWRQLDKKQAGDNPSAAEQKPGQDERSAAILKLAEPEAMEVNA
jgi:hypothetical protein